ncbi:MAG TPA: A24 family peptidase [Planctomycetaceae bacterium]|nr:A24 family peptidase [Planctomycetaceae bacterium]
MSWIIGGVLALVISAAAAWALEWLIDCERPALQLPPTLLRTRRLRPLIVTVSAVALMLALAYAEIVGGCLATPEVRPDSASVPLRTVFHCGLVLFLVLGTAIDLDCYLLPDQITFPGMIWGLAGAAWIADAQIAHLWVDWREAIPGISGPYIPEWYHQNRILHAVAWSGAGLLTGGVFTAVVRSVSSRLLGQEAMGFGDVTLMAMIGSVIGWQAVLATFAVAPLTGLLIALIGYVGFGRTYMPYGPCLAAAAIIVLFAWSRIWDHTRLFFSDPVAIGIILGIALTALVVLLGALRLYRAIPTKSA